MAWGPEAVFQDECSWIGAKRHHLQHGHECVLKKGSHGMMHWRLLAWMQDDGLELDINTVSATLSSCLFGVSMARGAPSSYMFEFQPGHEFILK